MSWYFSLEIVVMNSCAVGGRVRRTKRPQRFFKWGSGELRSGSLAAQGCRNLFVRNTVALRIAYYSTHIRTGEVPLY